MFELKERDGRRALILVLRCGARSTAGRWRVVVRHIQVVTSAVDAGDVCAGAGTRESKSPGRVALSLVEIVSCRTPGALTASPRTAQIKAK